MEVMKNIQIYFQKNKNGKLNLHLSLADVPEDALQKIYIFKNGVKGEGLYGYQDEVFSSTPQQESEYSALSSLIEVTWKTWTKRDYF